MKDYLGPLRPRYKMALRAEVEVEFFAFLEVPEEDGPDTVVFFPITHKMI